MVYGPPLLACNTFLPTLSQHSWLYRNSVICIYRIRIFYLSVHALLHTHHYSVVVSLCMSFYDGSVSSLTSEYIYVSCTDVLYQIWNSPFIHKAMLPRTLSSIDAMLCTVSASHAHVLGLPMGPTYLPLGRTPSILVNTYNFKDAHDAWVFVVPCTQHYHLPISDLVRGIGCGTSLAMLH